MQERAVVTEERVVPSRDYYAQSALAVFAVLVTIAGPLIVYWNRHQWFFLDEFDPLTERHLSSLHDVFAPHNEHWFTIPMVIYRVLWHFVGLHQYWPYQIPVVAAHLTVCVLLRVIMRRAGVDPWIATVAATALLFFGRGRDDLAWGFQISFTGSLALGLAQLVVADHDGPVGRRDLVALAFGLAGLMCSGVAVPMVAMVGLSVLLRRGWRAAAVQVLPLAVIHLAWSLAFPPQQETIWVGFAASFALFHRILSQSLVAIGGSRVAGALLVLIVLAGAGLVLRRDGVASVRGRLAPVMACLAGAVVFAGVIAFGRALAGPQGRYLHITAALVLPAIAVTGSALAERWRPLLPVVLVLLAAGIPTNVERVQPSGADLFTLGNREVLLVQAEVALSSGAPRDLRLQPDENDGLTVGWLVDGRRSGRIPPPEKPVDPALLAMARLQMMIRPVDGAPPLPDSCRPLGPYKTRLREGQRLIGEGYGFITVTGGADGQVPGRGMYRLWPDQDDLLGPGYVELEVLRPMGAMVTSSGTATIHLCSQ